MYGGVGRYSLCVWWCREVQLMCMGVWGGPAYVYGGVGRPSLCVWGCREVQLMCMVV